MVPLLPIALALAASADGRTLVVADTAHRIRVFDTASGAVRFGLGDYGNVAVAPDGDLIAVNWYDGIALLDAQTGAPVRTLAAGTGASGALSFSPDGKLLAAGMDWSTTISQGTPHVEVFDVASGASKWTAELAYGPHVAWSPDGKHLAAADLKTIRIFDKKGKQEQKLEIGTGFVTWSPDGTMLAYGDGMDLGLVDASSGAELAHRSYDTHDTPDHRGTTMVFSPDGWLGVPTASGIDWYTTPDLTLKYTWQEPLGHTLEIAFGTGGALYALDDFGTLRALDGNASKVSVLATLDGSGEIAPTPPPPPKQQPTKSTKTKKKKHTRRK